MTPLFQARDTPERRRLVCHGSPRRGDEDSHWKDTAAERDVVAYSRSGLVVVVMVVAFDLVVIPVTRHTYQSGSKKRHETEKTQI